MQIEISTLSTTKKSVQISVPADQVDRQFKTAYTQLQSRVTMAGFRRGKVPRKLLQRHYRDQLDSQVINELIQRTNAIAAEGS